MKNLKDITGYEKLKLEQKYLRAHRRHFKHQGQIAGDDLVKFRQSFMRKNKISTGV